MLHLLLLPSAQRSTNLLCRLTAVGALLLMSLTVPSTLAQTWPPAGHTPIADGDDTYYPPNAPHLYKGLYHGHLYGNWNVVGRDNLNTDRHNTDGLNAAGMITPLCRTEYPHCNESDKRIVVVGIGFSNWTKELCGEQTMTGNLPPIQQGNFFCDDFNPNTPPWSVINKLPQYSTWLNPKVVFVDCAIIGAISEFWTSDNPLVPFPLFNPPRGLFTNCNNILGLLNLSPNQVQVVLYKDSDSGRDICDPNTQANCPNPVPLVELPAYPSTFDGCTGTLGWGTSPDVCWVMNYAGQTGRSIWNSYPNVKQMYLHSRIYAGYANPTIPNDQDEKLNPEPFAYEHGFAMKWTIQSQVDEVDDHGSNSTVGTLEYRTSDNHGHTLTPVAPWIDWGAYMWASEDWTGYGGQNFTGPSDIPCNSCKTPGLSWKQNVRGVPGCGGTNPPCGCTQSGQECDFQPDDNTHPSLCGRDKVSNLLLYAYCTNKYMQPWLLANPQTGCPLTNPFPNSCDQAFRPH